MSSLYIETAPRIAIGRYAYGIAPKISVEHVWHARTIQAIGEGSAPDRRRRMETETETRTRHTVTMENVVNAHCT